MTTVNLVEDTECHAEEVLRAYEEVLLEAGYDPVENPGRPAEPLLPVMVGAVLEDDASERQAWHGVDVMLAAEVRYLEALLLGRATAPSSDGHPAP